MLTFRGRRDVTLRPGQDLTSDPVVLRTRAGKDVLVSRHAFSVGRYFLTGVDVLAPRRIGAVTRR